MESKERILEAAVRVFAEAGTRGATTRRIAEEAGVNEVTLFRHFGSKDRLLREALCHAAGQAPAAPLPREPADPERELVVWADRHLRHLLASRSLIRTSMGEFEEHAYVRSAACDAPRRVGSELVGYLQRLRERGMMRPDCNEHAAAALLMGAIFSDAMGRDMTPERYPYPPEEAATLYVRLFLRAVGASSAADGAMPSGAAADDLHMGTQS
jgi:AcrR family transcriptional regulator